METKQTTPAQPVDQPRLVRRIIVEVHGNMTPTQGGMMNGQLTPAEV